MEDPTYSFNEDLLPPRFDALPSPNLFSFLASPQILGTPQILSTPNQIVQATSSSVNSGGYFSYVPPFRPQALYSQPSSSLSSSLSSSSSLSLSSAPLSSSLSSLSSVSSQSSFQQQEAETFVTRQSVDGMILSCSENIHKFLGYDALSLCNTSTYELIHPDDLDKILQVHLKLLRDGPASKIQATYQVLRRSGDYAHIRSTFVNESNSVIACYSVDLCPSSQRLSPSVAFFCSEEQVSSSSDEQISLGSHDSLRCELRQFPGSLEEQDCKDEVLEEGLFSSASHSPALSPAYSPHSRHSSDLISENTSEGSSEYEDEEDDGSFGFSSAPTTSKVSRPKAKMVDAAKVSKAALLGRTREGNPKRERRMRRPPFGECCGECHILESTEWRKGPTANRLLCNACGLRYTRKVKKEMKEKLTSL